jgi:predicted outer membrane repeat protein
MKNRRTRRTSTIEQLEHRQLLATIAVTTLEDSGEGSLRAAITTASEGDTIDLTQVSGNLILQSEIAIDKGLTITGPGREKLSLSGNNVTRIFNISGSSTAPITVSNLTFSSGRADNGGAVYTNWPGELSFDRTDFTYNSSTNNGGAICVASGPVSISRSRLYHNTTASAGGAIVSRGNMTISRSTLAYNSATGSPEWAYATGGAVSAEEGIMTIVDSTIAHNSSSATGSSSFATGGGVTSRWGATLNLDRTTIAYNSLGGAFRLASGLSASGSMSYNRTLIAGNTGAPNIMPFHSSQGISGNNNINGDDILELLNLGTLGHWGGETPTVALLPGSLALDFVNIGTSAETDQRGFARDSMADIGSFERVTSGSEFWVNPNPLPSATLNQPYAVRVNVADVLGRPHGVSISTVLDDISTGQGTTLFGEKYVVLEGTPTTAGIKPFSIDVFYAGSNVTIFSNFNVVAPNTAPTIFGSEPAALVGTHTQSYQLTVWANDPDEQAMEYSLVDSPDWLTLTTNTNGSATISGNPPAVGTYDFTVRVSDGITQTNRTQTITINRPENYAPFLSIPELGTIRSWTSFSRTLTGFDADNDPVTASIASGPSWLTLVPGPGNTFIFGGNLPAGLEGNAWVTLAVSDGKGEPTTQTFQFEIERAAPVSVVDRELRIYASDGGDVVTSTRLSSGSFRISVNGQTRNFRPTSFDRVNVLAMSEHNTITLANLGNKPILIRADSGRNIITTGDGNDTIYAGRADDIIRSGGGNDSVFGESGADQLFGDGGNDRLEGGPGNDTLSGGAGIDQLLGQGGDDLFYTRDRSVDTITGGPGRNFAQVDTSDRRTQIQSLLA